MAILARCPNSFCKRYQSAKNKRCKCGEDLDAAKRAKRVRYSIQYRKPDGKLVKRSLDKEGLDPYSIKDARDANAKYTVKKRENKLFDISEDTEMTFDELTEWYLDQEPVKRLASFDIIKMKLKKFNALYGNMIVADIKKADLQNFMIKREKEGKKISTIDQDIGKVKAMVSMSFENDMVSGNTLKVFRSIKKQTKKFDDVRDRILSSDEFDSLMQHATGHTKDIISMGYYTGIRKGEILKLTWNKVKLDKRIIQLEPGDTKDREARNIPICKELFGILRNMPKRIQKAGDNSHVFLYKGKIVSDIRKGLRKACKAAGVKYGRNIEGGFVFHDLRHTFNTNMRKAGISDTVIMAITGHSTREMFDRYNTIDMDDIKKASKQFSEFISKSNDAHSDAPRPKLSKKNKRLFFINNLQ